jgi:hypothetical protein
MADPHIQALQNAIDYEAIIENLQGEQGERGLRGLKGNKGERRQDGEKGDRGQREERGELGNEELALRTTVENGFKQITTSLNQTNTTLNALIILLVEPSSQVCFFFVSFC